MAIYRLSIKPLNRSKGYTGPAAAAYRAGERIRDESRGRVYNHSYRGDVLHKEILVPSKYASDDMSWAKDRANLWNLVERREKLPRSRVAREYEIGLPFELSQPDRVKLARRFAQDLTDRYGFAMDLAVHAPRDRPNSDQRNFHAHLLATTREVNLESLGEKTVLEISDFKRFDRGLKQGVHEFYYARDRWIEYANDALREAGVSARVSCVLAPPGTERSPDWQAPQSMEDIQREARESWLRMRQGGEPSRENGASTEFDYENDHFL